MQIILRFVSCVLLTSVCCAFIHAQSNANSNAQRDEEIYTSKEVTQKVAVQSKPHPKLSKKLVNSLSKYSSNPTIRLHVVLRPNGEVTDIEVSKIVPENLPDDLAKSLTEATIEAAHKLKFSPAMKDNHPVAMRVFLEYVVNIF